MYSILSDVFFPTIIRFHYMGGIIRSAPLYSRAALSLIGIWASLHLQGEYCVNQTLGFQ